MFVEWIRSDRILAKLTDKPSFDHPISIRCNGRLVDFLEPESDVDSDKLDFDQDEPVQIGADGNDDSSDGPNIPF